MTSPYTEIGPTLKRLDTRRKVAFGASCCERMIDCYTAFCQMEQWGKPELARQALDQVWGWLKKEPFDGTEAKQWASLIRKDKYIIPDPGDFRTVFTDSASDGINAILILLEYCNAPKDKRIVDISMLGTDCVEIYIFELTDPITKPHLSDPNLRSWVNQSPLVLTENAKQLQDLAVLENAEALSDDFLDQLKQSCANRGVQPFQRGIVKRTL